MNLFPLYFKIIYITNSPFYGYRCIFTNIYLHTCYNQYNDANMYHYGRYLEECVAHGLDVQMHVHILFRILRLCLCLSIRESLYLFICTILSFNHNSSWFHMWPAAIQFWSVLKQSVIMPDTLDGYHGSKTRQFI